MARACAFLTEIVFREYLYSMSWRFRKYIKIAPGVKLNISKSGVSTTIGGKGASVNIGKNGAYLNTSIPGTGLYNRQKISTKPYRASGTYSNQNNNDNSYFKLGNNWGCVFRWLGLVFMSCLLIAIFKMLSGNFAFTEENIAILSFLTISVIFIYMKPITNFIKSLLLKNEEPLGTHKESKGGISSTDGNKTEDGTMPSTDDAIGYIKEPAQKKNLELNKDYAIVIHDIDPLFETAAHIIFKAQSGSTSLIQRKLSCGYNRAGHLMDQLEMAGIVGPVKGSKPREVLVHDEGELKRILMGIMEHSKIINSGTPNNSQQENIEGHVVKFSSDIDKANSINSNNKSNKRTPVLVARTIPNIGFVDPLLESAAVHIVEKRECNSMDIQRLLTIGYNRTARIIDQLEALQIIKRKTNNQYEVIIKDVDSLDKLLESLQDPNRPDNIFGVSEEFFNNAKNAVYAIESLYEEIKGDSTLMNVVENSLPQSYGTREQKLVALLFADIIKVYQHFGHSTKNLKNREGFALVLLSSRILGGDTDLTINYNTINFLGEICESVPSMLLSLNGWIDKYPDDNFFFVGQILNRCRRDDLYVRYFNLIYRMFSIIAKADNTVTEREANWLKLLMDSAMKSSKKDLDFNIENTQSTNKIATKPDTTKKALDPVDKLNKLIGLSKVKTEISSLSNLVKVQQVRKSRGMAVSNISYHCVFTGNPGTGKTTVARIVADIYKELGVLKKGHLVETDRSGLIAEYVGQTAVKTNAIIDSALDGVLFIDEAYSIVQGGQNDYGKEAIATLLKRMEDDRDRLVVILAGYTKEMAEFINANSGLQSRFNRYIEFPDYSGEELLQIFLSILRSNDCVATEEALALTREYIRYNVEHKDQNFGNARFVRNLFERVLTQQANRLAVENSVTNEMLSTIEAEDVKGAIE